MKIYEIYDEDIALSLGVLLYYDNSKKFTVELRDYLDEWTAPLLFVSYVKRGIYTIPSDVAFMWVSERIIPSGRQNIGDILSNHKFKEYDEFKFLIASSGRCSQDFIILKKMNKLPDFVLERQNKYLCEVVALENRNLLCFFNDGRCRKCALSDFANEKGIDKVMQNDELFNSVKISAGGTSILFNDSIEIYSGKLYNEGVEIALSLDDFKTFIKKNVYDTSMSTEELECSRQNLAYKVGQGQLIPIKENVNGNLYLKADIQKNKW